jgi:hypothetical protein
MSEIINAEFAEISNDAEAPAQKAERKFVLDMTFSEEGIQIDTRTNLTPLEQIGCVEIFKSSILNQNMPAKES